jgi:hypothetical protein
MNVSSHDDNQYSDSHDAARASFQVKAPQRLLESRQNICFIAYDRPVAIGGFSKDCESVIRVTDLSDSPGREGS